MIRVNQPFNTLEPLETYLSVLEEVTEEPTIASIADLQEADKALTDRALLFPHQEFVHDEGYRTFGYDPLTASDGVISLAKLALHQPGTEDFYQEFIRVFPIGDFLPDIASEASRRNTARSALIVIGGKLAVSGAFMLNQIEPAYEAIVESIDKIGERDKEFTNFGKKIISKYLFNELKISNRSNQPVFPISQREATRNVNSAWNVVGRPYGIFSKFLIK